MNGQNIRLAASAGIGLPTGQILVWILETFLLAEPIPSEVAIAIGSVLTALIHLFVRNNHVEKTVRTDVDTDA